MHKSLILLLLLIATICSHSAWANQVSNCPNPTAAAIEHCGTDWYPWQCAKRLQTGKLKQWQHRLQFKPSSNHPEQVKLLLTNQQWLTINVGNHTFAEGYGYLIDYYPEQAMYLFQEIGAHGHGYLMVDAKNGNLIQIEGLPVFAPNCQEFAVISNNWEFHDPTIQIWSWPPTLEATDNAENGSESDSESQTGTATPYFTYNHNGSYLPEIYANWYASTGRIHWVRQNELHIEACKSTYCDAPPDAKTTVVRLQRASTNNYQWRFYFPENW